MSDVESDGESDWEGAPPALEEQGGASDAGGDRPIGDWAPWENDLLTYAAGRFQDKNGQMQWGSAMPYMQERGLRRDQEQARNRLLRIKKGRSVPRTKKSQKCKRCGQFRRGHTCRAPQPPAMNAAASSSAPSLSAGPTAAAAHTPAPPAMNAASSSGSTLSAEPTATAVPALTPEQAAARDAAIAVVEESYRAVLARREVEAGEAAASSAATLEAVASNAEPTAATDNTPTPPAPRPTTPMPITPLGDAARTAPAGGTVRPPSPSYGFQPVPPPVIPVPSPQRMPSIPLDAMDPSMGTFGTTIAPPDEPMPLVLDVDHLERTRFSPPYDPFASSDGESMFEGRPSFDPSGTPDGSAAGGGFY